MCCGRAALGYPKARGFPTRDAYRQARRPGPTWPATFSRIPAFCVDGFPNVYYSSRSLNDVLTISRLSCGPIDSRLVLPIRY